MYRFNLCSQGLVFGLVLDARASCWVPLGSKRRLFLESLAVSCTGIVPLYYFLCSRRLDGLAVEDGGSNRVKVATSRLF